MLCVSGAAFANEYPAKPIRLIVPAAPGGGADFLARIVGVKLSELVGQSVVVDNRAGASGTIAADGTAKAAGDAPAEAAKPCRTVRRRMLIPHPSVKPD
jgi:tripartite-type tricarboxylate transporter receptor subunit TctC